MATKLKFPYTMHCPKCKTGLKIKSPKLIGTRISCPKCKSRIDVVTPDEDGMNPYGVEEAPEPEPIPEPTEDELLEAENEKKRKKRIGILKQVQFWVTVLIMLALVFGGGYVVWNFAIVRYMNDDGLNMPDEERELLKEFQ